MNEILLNIKPPCELTRCPKELREKMKASEWKNFSLNYPLVVFKNFMPRKYYQHWFLLVNSMHIILKVKFTDEENIVAKK